MKDLLVYVADADAQGFVRSLLNRPRALGIRAISFGIERHPQHDAGMVQSGPELARMHKRQFAKALLVWDHHGSGRDHKLKPIQASQEVQARLDLFTWKDNSATAVLVPELECWLWCCENAVLTHVGITQAEFEAWARERDRQLGGTLAELKVRDPKKLFEQLMRERLRRTISPRDFEDIGQKASIAALLKCDSFAAVLGILRTWFPE